MKTYDIFLFDADNTLYDYDKAEAHALKTMFDYCGFNYTENVRTEYRKINHPLWERFSKGEISKEDIQAIRFSRLFERVGVQYDAADFNDKYIYELGKCAFLIEGAEEVCRAIMSQGKQIFIVTNGVLATQESRLKHSSIKGYISGSFVSEHIGFQKPDRQYFDYVFANIPQVSKDRIIIVGDSLSADIAGGIAAGIDSCWFNIDRIENKTDIIPTYEIRTLSELHKFI